MSASWRGARSAGEHRGKRCKLEHPPDSLDSLSIICGCRQTLIQISKPFHADACSNCTRRAASMGSGGKRRRRRQRQRQRYPHQSSIFAGFAHVLAAGAGGGQLSEQGLSQLHRTGLPHPLTHCVRVLQARSMLAFQMDLAGRGSKSREKQSVRGRFWLPPRRMQGGDSAGAAALLPLPWMPGPGTVLHWRCISNTQAAWQAATSCWC